MVERFFSGTLMGQSSGMEKAALNSGICERGPLTRQRGGCGGHFYSMCLCNLDYKILDRSLLKLLW